MQFDQFLRRLFWRVRRRFRPAADNEPIVTVETGALPTALRRPPLRLLRTTLAFVLTLALLGAAYAALVAANSRVRLDAATVAPGEPGGSTAVAAVAKVLAFGEDRAAPDDDELVAPSTRRLREERVQAGALRAAVVYIARAGPLRGRLDPALADARAAIAGAQGVDRVAARDALLRFNARLSRGQAQLDTGAGALAGLLRAAADGCEAEAASLAQLAAAPSLIAAPAVDARVAEARGAAWAWLLIARGALADAPDVASRVTLEASIPLDALARIAERQPLFLTNGGRRLPWAPPHVAETAADFERAAAGARALAAAIDGRAG